MVVTAVLLRQNVGLRMVSLMSGMVMIIIYHPIPMLRMLLLVVRMGLVVEG